MGVPEVGKQNFKIRIIKIKAFGWGGGQFRRGFTYLGLINGFQYSCQANKNKRLDHSI